MHNIHPIIKEILSNRGISEESDILEFLSEKPQLTHDPFLLKGMTEAVELLLSTIAKKKKICIYGDYDADGVTSVSLMLQFLSHLSADVFYYIPSRFEEGYGLNQDAIAVIKERGADLILTVDCGSVSCDEVEFGKNLGMDFIITDHHNIDERMVNCILINPKQPGCPYPFKSLAGCGVAFKLAQGLQRMADLPKSMLTELLDLVAIATIGDIVPLVGENRTLTKHGLKVMNKGGRPGLKGLIEAVGLHLGEIKSESVAYIIVPHLNAAGRMMDAKTGVTLLTSREAKEISSTSAALVENNRERKRIQEEAFQQCRQAVEERYQEDLFLLIDGENIHEGIAGIVAGKIKDAFERPVAIVTPSGDEGCVKGTGRSIVDVNLYELLKEQEHLFLKFGGHHGACGFLMEAQNIASLRNLLNQAMARILSENPHVFDHPVVAEANIGPEELDDRLVTDLMKLEPFGCENEKPLLCLESLIPSRVSYMGDQRQHVRFHDGRKNGRGCDYVLFQKAQDYEEMLCQGTALRLFGSPGFNYWNGNKKIQFVLTHITC